MSTINLKLKIREDIEAEPVRKLTVSNIPSIEELKEAQILKRVLSFDIKNNDLPDVINPDLYGLGEDKPRAQVRICQLEDYADIGLYTISIIVEKIYGKRGEYESY